MKIIFFGTNKFAETILEKLIQNSDIEVSAVITQPNKPVGRKKELQSPPVKILAKNNNIKVYQPETLKGFDLPEIPDLNIVVEYGFFIPNRLIKAPEKGTINIHPSALPKYRGASPIQSAILNGEKKTAVSIMLMDEKMDHGPILTQEETQIYPDETYPVLSERLANRSADLLNKILPLWANGKIEPAVQDDKKATFCGLIKKEDGMVDFNKETSEEIYNKYRAYYLWPQIWTTYQDKRLKLLEIKPSDEKINAGKMVFTGKKLLAGCFQGAIEIVKIQPEGKKPMDAKAFANGFLK